MFHEFELSVFSAGAYGLMAIFGIAATLGAIKVVIALVRAACGVCASEINDILRQLGIRGKRPRSNRVAPDDHDSSFTS